MKVLLTGAHGQAGRALQARVPAGIELHAVGSSELDITRGESVRALLQELRPALVLNAAAYTAVDRAEQEPEQAAAVNADGAGLLARAADEVGARMLHISTDFVFDGNSPTPYRPGDETAPLSVYGRTKLEGERRVLAACRDAVIVRTAWLYGDGGNFVNTMLRLMGEREELSVVADQVGTPTSTATLAQALWAAAARPALQGVYHWSDAGVASWYDFAVAIEEEGRALGLLSRPTAVRPIATADYPTPARRPAYSVLDKSASWRDFGVTPLHWRQALRQMLKDRANA